MEQKRETEEENSDDSEISEEDAPKNTPSPRKGSQVGPLTNPYGGLRQQLNNMTQEERQNFGDGVATALRARAAREDDTVVLKAKAWNKLNGGIHTNTDAVFDAGCTHHHKSSS